MFLKTPAPDHDEPDVWQVSWDQRMLPSWLLRTHRVNEIRVDKTNDNGCVSFTRIAFNGPLAWIIKLASGAMIQGVSRSGPRDSKPLQDDRSLRFTSMRSLSSTRSHGAAVLLR
jgi:hypothetical protein